MASYFDEHDVPEEEQESSGNDRVSYLLDLARLLHSLMVESGNDLNSVDIDSIFSSGTANPPASKEFVSNLPTLKSDQCKDNCPICLAGYEDTNLIKQLPKCKHIFHAECIIPWLEKTNTCPVCRKEYPTDDAVYEEKRKYKEDEAQRRQRMEDLHNSMFC